MLVSLTDKKQPLLVEKSKPTLHSSDVGVQEVHVTVAEASGNLHSLRSMDVRMLRLFFLLPDGLNS